VPDPHASLAAASLSLQQGKGQIALPAAAQRIPETAKGVALYFSLPQSPAWYGHKKCGKSFQNCDL